MTTGHEHPWDTEDMDLASALDQAPLWSVPFGQVLLDAVELRRGIRALDVGCGTGYPLLELAQRLGPSARAVGLDPWRAARERVRFKIRCSGVTNVEVVGGTAEAMPFGDRSFDLITSNNGLNNVGGRAAAWKECARVARPGAQMVATENLPRTMIEFYRVYEEVLVELGRGDRVGAMRAQIRAKRLPLDETTSLIEEHGFQIRSAEERSFCLRYLDGTTMLGHFLIRAAFLEGFKSILDPADREPVFAVLERRLNERAQRSGGLTLTVPFVCIDCRRAG